MSTVDLQSVGADARAVRWQRLYVVRLVAVDLLAGLNAGLAAYFLRFGQVPGPNWPYLMAAGALPVGWVIAVLMNRAYETRYLFSGGEEYRRVLNAAACLTAAIAIAAYSTHTAFAREYVLLSMPLLLGLDLALRAALRFVLSRRRTRGECLHCAVVFGSGHEVQTEPAAPSSAVKRVFDVVVAGLCLGGLSPLFLIVFAAVRLSSTGPALFVQTRVGKEGKEFRLYKFRSMYVDAEERLAELQDANEYDGVLFKIKEDPRVTRIGRHLRRFSIDELPQLLNVLKGDMSLVGPRPPLPREVSRYAEGVRRRLAVVPGLTGLWQVSGRSDLSWEESVRLDLQYVENWSLSLDLVILFRTVAAVVRPYGAY
ncbi:sugar transferase [Cryptosporangium sp. NPDC048952]|uniref:sugar transferase n=1 Tax=Cryptosporangium sp. NPDC048952 TaxID=3363961 RepID=UPI00372118FA